MLTEFRPRRIRHYAWQLVELAVVMFGLGLFLRLAWVLAAVAAIPA